VVLNFPTAKTCHLEVPNPVDTGGSVALKDFVHSRTLKQLSPTAGHRLCRPVYLKCWTIPYAHSCGVGASLFSCGFHFWVLIGVVLTGTSFMV
jgi:hypothetical protein